MYLFFWQIIAQMNYSGNVFMLLNRTNCFKNLSSFTVCIYMNADNPQILSAN